MGAETMLRRPVNEVSKLSCSDLVNFVHAFTKVHVLHPAFFRDILGLLDYRFEELTPQDLVKFLHGAAKVDLELPDGLQVAIAETLSVDVVQRLGVFELLKLATAA